MSQASSIEVDGGAVDILPEHKDLFSTRPGMFTVGDLVTVLGEEGSGTVLEVNTGRAQVELVHKRTGRVTTSYYPLKSLSILRRVGAKTSLKLYSYSELSKLKPVEPLIEDVVRTSALGSLYGPAGCGKSFIAISMAACVATGTPWFGHDVSAGPVVYIAAEGMHGIRKRIKAWLIDRDGELEAILDSRLFILAEALDLVGDEGELLVAAVQDLGIQPVLIVVDTLARCSGTGDENKTHDMNRFVASCDRLSKATGAAVLVVHHTGKQGEVERGSSALRGAAEVMLKATAEPIPGGKLVQLVGDKAKDDEELREHTFRLETVQVGFEANGRPETSCRLVPDKAPEKQAEKQAHFPDLTSQGLTICRTLRDSFFEDGAGATALREASKIPKQTFATHVKAAVDAGYLYREKSGRNVTYTLLAKFTEQRVPQVPIGPEPCSVLGTDDKSQVRHVPPPVGAGRVGLETHHGVESENGTGGPHA